MYRQIQIGRDIDRYIEVEKERAFLRKWTTTESLEIKGAILTIDRNGIQHCVSISVKYKVYSGVQGYSFIHSVNNKQQFFYVQGIIVGDTEAKRFQTWFHTQGTDRMEGVCVCVCVLYINKDYGEG